MDDARSKAPLQPAPNPGGGVVVAGRYRLGRVLGAGGMGTVHEAEHLGTGGAVALKLLNADRLATPKHHRRFEMEARNAAVLQHANTVRVFDYGLDDNLAPPLPYLVMELVRGRSVAELIDEGGRLPWPRVVRIASQMLKSLWEAHEHPRHIIHRDIKPSNVLVCDLPGEPDFVKVADFGVARALSVPGEGSEEVAGSFSTMAPECWVGAAIGPATDLYSVGCTVYEMLAGGPPFRANEVRDWARLHRSTPPPPLSVRARPGTPADLVGWVEGLLRKQPALRPASAREALRLLEAIGPAPAVSLRETAPEPPGNLGGDDTVELDPSQTVAAPRRGAVRESASRPLTNLPPTYAAFVGRGAECEALSRLVAGEARLVTVHGPGGTGKTRLVVEWARGLVGELAGGVWFADLTAALSLEDVLQVVARVLRVPLTEREPAEQLAAAIGERGGLLLVLDNAEQVAEPIRQLLAGWLASTGEAVFLVTSRKRLGLAGEHVLSLAPLALPEPSVEGAALVDNEAVSLFVERARAVQPEFALGPDNAADVAALVHQLDGLPLGIELAAARVRLLPPARLLERLRQQGLEPLVRPDGPGSGRHAALGAAMDWSWRLLDGPERHALAQCCVFRGGYGLDAAERIVDLSAWPNLRSVVDVLESLCDQSLLVVSYPERDEPRFSMLVSVRAFAASRLSEVGAVEGPGGESLTGPDAAREVAERHAAHYARLGADAFVERLGHDPEAVAHLERDLGNLWAAWAHGVADSRARAHAVAAFGAIRQLARRRGPYGLALEAGRPLAACADLDPYVRASVLVDVAGVANMAGQLDEAARCLEDAERLLAAVPPRPALRAMLCAEQALLRHYDGRLETAKKYAERALEQAETAADARLQLDAATVLAATVRLQGDMERAVKLFERGIELARRLADRAQEARCHANLGAVFVELDRAQAARTHLHYADQLARRMGDRRIQRWARMNWAVMSRDLGEMRHARTAVEQARDAAEREGDARLAMFCRVNRAMFDLDQGRHAEVRERIAADVAAARATKQPRLLGMMLLQQVRLQLELGELDAARRTNQDFYAVMESLGDPLMQLTARLLMARLFEAEGGFETAEAFLGDALAVAEEHQAVRGEGEVLGYQAQVRLAAGRAREAGGLAAAGVERLRGIDAAFELGVALAQQARVARAVGDVDLADAVLAEAEGIGGRIEAAEPCALAVAIRRAREQSAGVRRGGSTPSPLS